MSGGITTYNSGTGGTGTPLYKQSFTATAGQTTFTLTNSGSTVILLFIDGVENSSITATISGTTLTLGLAQDAGTKITVSYR